MSFIKTGLSMGKAVFFSLKNYIPGDHRNLSRIKYRIVKEKNAMLLEEDIRENRFILRSYPPFVGLGTDYRCNLSCLMCTQRLVPRENLLNTPTIDEKALIKFAEEVFPTAVTLQMNTAGEPLMSRNFELELELADKYCVKLDVITNGVLLNSTQGRLRKLCRNAGSISFSFDSPVKQTYETIRIGSDYDKVVENMRLYQKLRLEISSIERPSFGISMVLMKRNLSELLQMVRFAKDMGADHLGLSKVHIHSREMEEESLDTIKHEVNQALVAAKELADSLGILISAPPLYDTSSEINVVQNHENSCSETDPPAKLKWCPFLWKRVYIDEKARILVCCEPSHPTAGSIIDTDFLKIWNGEDYVRMRKTFTGGPAFKYCYECASSGYLTQLNIV